MDEEEPFYCDHFAISKEVSYLNLPAENRDGQNPKWCW